MCDPHELHERSGEERGMREHVSANFRDGCVLFRFVCGAVFRFFASDDKISLVAARDKRLTRLILEN